MRLIYTAFSITILLIIALNTTYIEGQTIAYTPTKTTYILIRGAYVELEIEYISTVPDCEAVSIDVDTYPIDGLIPIYTDVSCSTLDTSVIKVGYRGVYNVSSTSTYIPIDVYIDGVQADVDPIYITSTTLDVYIDRVEPSVENIVYEIESPSNPVLTSDSIIYDYVYLVSVKIESVYMFDSQYYNITLLFENSTYMLEFDGDRRETITHIYQGGYTGEIHLYVNGELYTTVFGLDEPAEGVVKPSLFFLYDESVLNIYTSLSSYGGDAYLYVDLYNLAVRLNRVGYTYYELPTLADTVYARIEYLGTTVEFKLVDYGLSEWESTYTLYILAYPFFILITLTGMAITMLNSFLNKREFEISIDMIFLLTVVVALPPILSSTTYILTRFAPLPYIQDVGGTSNFGEIAYHGVLYISNNMRSVSQSLIGITIVLIIVSLILSLLAFGLGRSLFSLALILAILIILYPFMATLLPYIVVLFTILTLLVYAVQTLVYTPIGGVSQSFHTVVNYYILLFLLITVIPSVSTLVGETITITLADILDSSVASGLPEPAGSTVRGILLMIQPLLTQANLSTVVEAFLIAVLSLFWIRQVIASMMNIYTVFRAW